MLPTKVAYFNKIKKTYRNNFSLIVLPDHGC